MPYIDAIHFEYSVTEADGDAASCEVRKGALKNPYHNYLHLLRHLKNLATTAEHDELLRFADCGHVSLRNPGSAWSRYALLLFQWTDGPHKPGWYDFEEEAYTQLLTEDDVLQGCYDGMSFKDLDYYLTALAERRALIELEQGPELLQPLWLHEALADFYWHTLTLRPLLGELAERLGWPWFCGFLPGSTFELHPDFTEMSPTRRFRYGFLALLAAHEHRPVDPERQRQELVALHDRLVLDHQVEFQSEHFKELRSLIQDAIDQVPELGL